MLVYKHLTSTIKIRRKRNGNCPFAGFFFLRKRKSYVPFHLKDRVWFEFHFICIGGLSFVGRGIDLVIYDLEQWHASDGDCTREVQSLPFRMKIQGLALIGCA
jgi:hypothetical protein